MKWRKEKRKMIMVFSGPNELDLNLDLLDKLYDVKMEYQGNNNFTKWFNNCSRYEILFGIGRKRKLTNSTCPINIFINEIYVIVYSRTSTKQKHEKYQNIMWKSEEKNLKYNRFLCLNCSRVSTNNESLKKKTETKDKKFKTFLLLQTNERR